MIVGQDRAVAAFGEALRSGAVHHGWLLAGPRGVGKASFAHVAATRLLAEAGGPAVELVGLGTPEEHRVARLMAAGSHPDFRRLEREPNERGDGLRRSITVAQIRKLGEFMANTAALSPWRAVVIDSVDELEAAGANALLKMLEEPPANTVFFLVSHAPGRLLPTIRSRCRRVDFQTLDEDALTSILRRTLDQPDEAELARLVRLGDGSAGRASGYAGLDLATLEADALALLREGDPTNARRSRLAQSLAGKPAAERYAAFLQMAPSLVAREARRLDGPTRLRALDAYGEVREIAGLAQRLSLDPAATVFQIGTILASVP